MELIDTCFGTHHLQFDQDGVLWVSGDSYVLGWFDPSTYDPERPETAEQAGGYAEITGDGDGDGTADTPISASATGSSRTRPTAASGPRSRAPTDRAC